MEYEFRYESAELPGWVIPFILAVSLFYIICGWRIFAKAGQPGWASLIPFYNIYIATKIGGKPGYWTLLVIFIPFVFGIWLLNMIVKSFGKDEGFTVGLLFLGFIFYPILAFGGAKYLGPYGNQAEFQARRNSFEFENQNQNRS